MFSELESIFARWGLISFILGVFSSLLYVFTGIRQEIIQVKSILLVFALCGVMFAASFTLFRAYSSGLEIRINEVVSTDLAMKYKKSLVAIAWLILIALPFGVLGLKLTGIADGTNFYDFGAYYNAAERVIHGYPLYDWTIVYPEVTHLPNSPDRYLYAPLVSLLFVPFAALPFEKAALAWSAVSISVYLAGITAFLKTITTSLSRREWIIVYTASLGFGPFIITFISGQVTGVLAGILCFAGVGYRMKEKDEIPSILTTISVVFKVYYAPAGAPLLRDRRRVVGALITGVSIILAGVFVFDLQTTIEYFEVLTAGKGWGSAIDPPISWNINDFHPFYFLDSIGYLIRVLLLATIATVAYRSRRYEFEYADLYMYSLGLLGIVLGSPVFATSGLIITVPVILILLTTTIDDRPGIFITTLVATILIHVHPYTNEFLSKIFLPAVGGEAFASLVLPIVQPAVWGIFLLLACVTYEYTWRIPNKSN